MIKYVKFLFLLFEFGFKNRGRYVSDFLMIHFSATLKKKDQKKVPVLKITKFFFSSVDLK